MNRPAPPQLAQKPRPALRKPGAILQPKLMVGPARDRFETEADRIADRVVSRSDSAAPAAAPAISRLTAGAVQREAAPKMPKPSGKAVREDEETPVQRAASGPATAPQSAEGAIARMRAAGGQKLAPEVQSRMEGGLGRPLDNVRVHDGAGAAKTARDVGAHAFTVGQDVFFGAGQYKPETQGGERLLAHELVHTEQQKGLGVQAQTMAIQREPTAPVKEKKKDDADETPKTEEVFSGKNGGKIKLASGGGGELELDHLQIPIIHGGVKGASNFVAPGQPGAGKGALNPSGNFVYTGASARETSASQEFVKNKYYEAAENQVEPNLVDLIPKQVQRWDPEHSVEGPDQKPVFYLRLDSESAANASNILFGTVEQLADNKRIKLPNWNKSGKKHSFDVDHSQELQLGGLDAYSNFWLMDASANRSSGAKISNALEKDIDGAISALDKKGFWAGQNASKKPSFDKIKSGKSGWTVKFAKYQDLPIKNESQPYWLSSEIKAGDHLAHLKVMTHAELIQEGLKLTDKDGKPVTPKRFSLFSSAGGGWRRRMKVNKDGTVSPDGKTSNFLGGFDFVSAVVNPADVKAPYITKINGWAFRRKKKSPLEPQILLGDDKGIPVTAIEGGGFSGAMDMGALYKAIGSIKVDLKNTSPITFHEAGVNADGMLFANGTVSATKALFPQLEFPIHILGSDIFVDFPIPTEKLNFGPVSVTEASLKIGVGDDGAFLEGAAALAVDRVGSGEMKARVAQDNTLIEGKFNFDLDFLDKTQADFKYDLGQDLLTLGFEAGVGKGKIPGVSGGTVKASFSREAVSLDGQLMLAGPLSGTIVKLSYSEKEGLKLGADDIPLPVEKIPGVKSAKASLYAKRNPETGEWMFGGGGKAEIAVPGTSGEIGLTVDGERVVITGNLKVEKSPASGSIGFTATNAPVDEEGNVQEGPPNDSYTVFGKGSAEIKFGDIIKGTAGIELNPDATIHVSGEIALAKDYELFKQKDFSPKSPLVDLETPQFPIFAVGAGPLTVGITASIGGYLTYKAYVGPGKLINSSIKAEMDLDKPEDAKVTGTTTFDMPAYAGLILGAQANLYARATAAYARGTVGLEGEAALLANASAKVDVAWNRNDGFEVGATGKATLKPQLVLRATAELAVGADLYFTEVEKAWGPWKKELGRFSPNLEMGLTIPAKWSEKNGLDFSLDDMVIDTPKIDAKSVISDVADKFGF